MRKFNSKNLKSTCIGLFAGLCLCGSSFAMDEVTLQSANTNSDEAAARLIAANTVVSPYDTSDYDFQNAVLEKSAGMMTLSDEANFRTSQAVSQATAVQLDAGVAKDETPVEIDKSEASFFDRIFKEEYRYKPIELFNKQGMQFERGPIKSIKFGFYYTGIETMTWPYQDRLTSKWKDTAAELSIITRFRNDKTSLRLSYNFLRDIDGHASGFMERFSEIGLVHDFNKNQHLHIGQTFRLPIGVEGGISTFNQDLPTRSQIARTFGDTRSFGVRNIASYKYMDYDIGVYNATRYWQKFNGTGADFTGWVNFKPFAALDSNKFGKLTLGTGVSAGRNATPYTVWGAYVGYDYKRFHNKFEYSHANGYNSTTVNSTAKAEGFYDTILIDLTKDKKLQLIGRYDYFNPNLDKANNIAMEYTGGLSYKFNNCLKLVAAYTYRHVDNGTYSNAVTIRAHVKI